MSSLSIRPLNVDLQEIAKSQLFETDANIADDIRLLKEWILKSPHLRSRMDHQFLISFIRGCKHSLERAKQKLDMYYTLRTHIPEFSDPDPFNAKTLAILKLGVGLPLPKTESSKHPRIMLFRPGAYNAKIYTIQDVMKVSMIINDIILIEDDTNVVAGQIGIVDLANVTLDHFIQMQPAFVKRMSMMFQDGLPFRQKGIHYINTPPGFETFFRMMKGFLNEKMRSRLSVHSSVNTLYSIIPKSLMPSDYGGEGESLSSITEKWEKKVLSHREYILEQRNYGVDEKKRIGRPKNPDSLFGSDGTFRQLQFD